jgi:hypothetical protein
MLIIDLINKKFDTLFDKILNVEKQIVNNTNDIIKPVIQPV